MNAYELADWLHNYFPNSYEEWMESEEQKMQEIISMLRQQQAEIEALKAVLGRYVKEVPLGNQPHMLAEIALDLVNG